MKKSQINKTKINYSKLIKFLNKNHINDRLLLEYKPKTKINFK